MELAKALAKFLFIAPVAACLLWNNAGELMGLGAEPIHAGLAHAARLAGHAFLMLAGTMGLIAAVDVPWQLCQHNQKLKMSREEIKEEAKESDGSPEMKGHIRRAQSELARRRMMQEVPKADVVVTNPTHFAVALRYDEKRMRAPIVVAKGADVIAARIREIATENNVPIFEAPPLARALHRNVDIGGEIPSNLYVAVAQVLTYIYQVKTARRYGAVMPQPPGYRSGPRLLRRAEPWRPATAHTATMPSLRDLIRTGRRRAHRRARRLAMVVLPLPPMALDMLFTFNIALSIIIMMAVFYVSRPVEFGVFPTVLLVATLLRLALNVASTRVVLLHGHTGPGAAGHVIQSFGEFVIGGNFAVGVVVFIILTIINFVVVTKGSGRISEVSARFTLDAMPGKQMAIDADLNAGLITQDEARARRARRARGSRLLRLHGRCQQVRPRRRGRRHPDSVHQHHRRPGHRHHRSRPADRRSRQDLHPADHR